MTSINFKALLFDLDGTLINSHKAVERIWRKWCSRHAIEFETANQVLHGRPAAETMRLLLPNTSEAIIQAEKLWLEQLESTDVEDIEVIPGARELIAELNAKQIPWAIVTSGALPVAKARVKAVGFEMPEVFVTPELISKGKPDPEPFLLAAKLLNVEPDQCVVFEDAPVGIKAGIAANSTVVAVLSQSSSDELPEASFYTNDLSDIRLKELVEGNGEYALTGYHKRLQDYAGHIGVPVKCIEATAQFYRSLGFRVVCAKTLYDDDGAEILVSFMAYNELLVEFYQLEQHKAKSEPGPINHIAVRVDDLEPVQSLLNQLDIPLIKGPNEVDFGAKGMRYIMIEGPDKERIEFDLFH